MSKINSEILEVKRLITEVNELLYGQKIALDNASHALAGYAKNAVLPSSFVKMQKEIEANNQLILKIEKEKLDIDLKAERINNAKIDGQKKELPLKEAQIKADERLISKANEKIKSSQKESDATKEKNRLYNELVEKHKALSKELKDLIILSLKSENSSQELTNKIKIQSKELSDLNYQLAVAEQGTKKYSVGAKSAVTYTAELTKSSNKLTDAYSSLSLKRNESARALQNSIIETGKSSSQTKILTKDFEVLDKKLASADKAIGKLSQSNNGIRTLATSFNYLLTAFGIGTGLDILFDLGKSVFNITKEFNSLDLALKNVTVTGENFAGQKSFLAGISDKYGIELRGLTKEFTNFYSSAKDKLSSTQIQEIFESISNAGANMGLTVESQNGAFLALEQMMSKGSVQSEELRSQLGERLPGAFEIAQKAYQKLHPEINTTNKFMGEMKKGLVSSAELLPVLAKEFESTYGIENRDRVDTIASAINRVKNSWSNWVLGLSADNTTVKVLVGLLNGLASNLDLIINTIGTAVGAWSAYRAVFALQLLQTELMTVAHLSNATALEAETLATKEATIATKSFNTALKANILGLVVAGLLGLIWAYEHFSKSALESSKEVEKSTDKFVKHRVEVTKSVTEVNKLVNEYDSLRKKKKLSTEESTRLNEVTKLLSKQYPSSVTAMGKYGDAISVNTETIKLYNKVKREQLELDRKDNIEKEADTIKDLFKELQHKLEVQEQKQFHAKMKRKNGVYKITPEEELEINQLKLKIKLHRDYLASLKGDVVEPKKQPDIITESTPLEGTEEEKNKRLKSIEDALKAKNQLLTDDYNARLSNLEREKNIQELYLDNDRNFNNEKLKDFEKGVDKKIRLSKLLYDKEIEISKTVFEEKKRLINLEAKERKLTESGKKNLLIPASNDFAKNNDESFAKLLKRNSSYYKEFYDSMDNLEKDNPIRTPTMWSKDTIDENEKKQKEDKELKDKALKEQIEDEKDRIKLFNEHVGKFATDIGFGNSFDMFTKLDKHGTTMWERLKDKSIDGKRKFGEVFAGMATIAQDAYNKIAESSMVNYEHERDILDKQKADALEFAGSSEEAKEKIELQYQEKQREIRRKEFKAKQEQALVNIAIDTATAIMMTYGQLGLIGGTAGAFVLAGLGIAQAALVSSQEMPEYWTGTDNAKGGLALTQEKGQEIITNKYGVVKDLGDNKGARVTKLDSGDEVYNAQKTREMLFNNELKDVLQLNGINYHNIVENKGLTAYEMKNIMVETIGGRPTLSLNIDENGFNLSSHKNGSITKRAESRGHGKGIEFK